MQTNPLRQPILALMLFAVAWLILGVALARAYLEALWTAPSPFLSGLGLLWLVLGALAVIALHVRWLVRIWQVA